MKGADLIEIGRVVAINIKENSVTIKASTDFPERFLKMDMLDLYSDDRHVKVAIVDVSVKGNTVKARVGYGTDVSFLKGMFIKVSREGLFELPSGVYYVFDIVGCKVFGRDGRFIGEVVDVIRTGSNDVYQVKRVDKKDIFIPALRDVVKKVDVRGRVIEVLLPEGLIEIYEG